MVVLLTVLLADAAEDSDGSTSGHDEQLVSADVQSQPRQFVNFDAKRRQIYLLKPLKPYRARA
jgi:hypothetical protein